MAARPELVAILRDASTLSLPSERGRERVGAPQGEGEEKPRMRIDISFLPALAATFMLMFGRIGTMVMLLPGLGEFSVPARVRLTVALVLAAVLLPLHRSAYQIDLKTFGPVFGLL